MRCDPARLRRIIAHVSPHNSSSGSSFPSYVYFLLTPTTSLSFRSQGYDATYFASKGFKSSWGIDISPTAVEVAQEYLLAQPDHPINVELYVYSPSLLESDIDKSIRAQ